MKSLKFKHDLAIDILEGRKTITWRLFDDKNLTEGDELELIDKENLEKFAEAKITNIEEKEIKDLTQEELIGHGYKDRGDMIESHEKYYGDNIKPGTLVKIIEFELTSTKNTSQLDPKHT